MEKKEKGGPEKELLGGELEECWRRRENQVRWSAIEEWGNVEEEWWSKGEDRGGGVIERSLENGNRRMKQRSDRNSVGEGW